MYEIIQTNNAEVRGFIVRNTETATNVKTHRFYDDAMSHLRRLENARIRRLRDRNVKAFA